jgi:hypothetical protein
MAMVGTKQVKWIRCSIPIAAAALAIFIIETVARGTPYFTLAPVFAILVVGIYYGGTIAGTVIGLGIIIYSFYASPDLARAIIISVSVFFIVAPIIFLKRLMDNADEILARLRDLDVQITGAEIRWPHLSEAEKLTLIRQLQHRIANLVTLNIGWRELFRERETVLRDYDKKTHKAG